MPAGRRTVWAPAAKADLRDIWQHYADAASLDTADKMLRGIASAVVRLDRVAVPGRPRDELMPGLRSLLARPHTIFFRLRKDRIEIVRVLHERRNMAALFDTKQS